MEQKTSPKAPLVILGLIAVVFLANTVFVVISFQGSYAKPSSLTGNQTAQDLGQTNPKLPVRLEIPKINVNAPVEQVGLAPQGTMAVPKGPTDVAWFDLGPRPGESGSAVIAGHEGWKDGVAAVFDNLRQLQKGDQIYITDEENTTTTFVVREIRTYDQNGDASDIFNSNDGKAHLNLITCDGAWNTAQKSYSNRLVVFADGRDNMNTVVSAPGKLARSRGWKSLPVKT